MSPRTCTFIDMVYQPDTWLPNGVHECEGWIARWQVGDHGFVGWAKTRKASYNKALRAYHRMQKGKERNKAINRLVMDVEMAVEQAVRAGVKRRLAYQYVRKACINHYDKPEETKS